MQLKRGVHLLVNVGKPLAENIIFRIVTQYYLVTDFRAAGPPLVNVIAGHMPPNQKKGFKTCLL